MVELKTFRVNRMYFENRVKPGTQLNLKNHIDYSINHFSENKTCVGTLEFKITDESARPFECRLDVVAEFAYTDDESKDDIHIKSFDQLFPFLRQIINTITSSSGMQGLVIPIIHLSKDYIMTNDNAENGTENSPLN